MYPMRFLVLTGLIVIAAASRLVPHPSNFTPVGAMALLGGACFADRHLAFGVPLVAMLLSDLVLGFHSGMPAVYLSFALIVCLGFWLRGRRRLLPVAGMTLASALLFFGLTNFAVWTQGSMYPRTAEGLATCYLKAVPFFGNTLLGDAFYATVLFGGLALAEAGLPALRASAPQPAL